jgi:hypothetical protein
MRRNALSRAIVNQSCAALETRESGRICRSPSRKYQKKLFAIKDLKPHAGCIYSNHRGTEQAGRNLTEPNTEGDFHEHPDPLP